MSHLLKSTLSRSRLSGTRIQRGANRTNFGRFFATDSNNQSPAKSSSSSSPEIVDTQPKKKSDKKKKKSTTISTSKRLPSLSSIHLRDEFPRETRQEASSLRRHATQRMMQRAWTKVSEPPTLHLIAASAVATFGIAGVEATLLCTSWPWESSLDTSLFVARYAVEQVLPSIVWQTQPAELVLRALDLPTEVLRNLGTDAASASVLLHVQRLQTSRHLIAGFMMIAQLVRAAGVSSDAFSEYQESIRRGREPPLLPNGLVTRFCGVTSPVTELSLQSMGRHLLPVYEYPEKVQFLLSSSRTADRQPVYWCVHPGTYSLHHAWNRFPVDQACLLSGTGSNADERLLILEADATNENDPLGLGETALDLTLDDASQGFRRILEAYHQQGYLSSGEGMKGTSQNNSFRPLRVYLGNSLEVGRTGGGHSYTLRHRVRYAKEVDVLLDSRAPVLQEILHWCQQVVGEERRLFVQTSSRSYFLNLQKLLKEYGYDVYDPLDLRMMEKLQQDEETREGSEMEDAERRYSKSLLSVLMEDSRFVQEEWDDLEFLQDVMFQKKADASPATSKGEMLRQVAQMSKIPRLVHYETTAQTVNAVQSLITAGQVDETTKCCALLDHPEGVSLLETVLHQREVSSWNATPKHDDQDGTKPRSDEVDDHDSNAEAPSNNEITKVPSVQIICSSSIHDRLFRQVRTWARMGYSDKEIQREVDYRFQDILHQSHQVQQEVVEDLVDDGPHAAAEQSEDSSSSTATSETTSTEQTKKE